MKSYTSPDHLIDKFNTFVDRSKTTCLIDYSKIEYINKQVLEKTNKDILVFLWENKLQDYHHEILNDIFETDIALDYNKIHIYQSHTVKDRKYYLITLPYDPDSLVERMFFILYKDQNILEPTKDLFP